MAHTFWEKSMFNLCYTSFLVLFFNLNAIAQQDSIPTIDSLSVFRDSLSLLQDSIPLDSTRRMLPPSAIKHSKDALDDPVDYAAKDSIVYDIVNKKIYLYGEAAVTYTSIELKADYIILDWDKNEVLAEYTQDKTGKKKGIPNFKDGDQDFTANRMRYNFLTKKGIIYDVTSRYNDLYVLGSKAKFISKGADSLKVNDYVYSENAIFTTCDHPIPHYGIRSRKQKLVPNDVVVVGPSNLEIMGIPTPLWLPFGFFPITSDRRQGLLFPKDYEYSPEWGYGLRNIGYYLPINEYMDLSATADIYYKGTYRLHFNSRYKKRYKYSGSLRLDFSNERIEQSDASILPSRALSLGWSHSQDQRAHPYQSLSGSVNIQTNSYQSLTQNNAQAQLNNSLSSNVSYRRSFPDLPLSFSASMSHSQNTRTNQVRITLPTTDLATQTLFPFKRKKKIGKEKWYEQITLRYKNQFKNQFETTDSTLFTQETLDNAQYGMKHEASSGTSFKLFKHFSVNPNVSYNEVWYLKTIEKQFVEKLLIDTLENINPLDSTDVQYQYDTLSNGTLEEMQNSGFARYRQFNAGVSINTQIFGTWQSSKGWLRGVRHVIKPSVSMNYSPNNQNPNLGYFDTVIYEDINGNQIENTYSIFDKGIYGKPSNSGQQANISYSITNNFEAKYYSKKDSTEHKFSLFDNISIRGSYNVAADTLKFSKVSVNGTTRLFKKITTFSFTAGFDPYNVDADNRRVESFYWKTNKRPLRFDGATARLNSSISVSKIRDIFTNGFGETKTTTSQDKKKEKPEDLLSLFERFTINHVFSMEWDLVDQRDTFLIRTHSLSVRGNIDLTNKWSVQIGNIGYDFKSKRLSYPDFGLSRSLHCWRMGISAQPTYGTYQFYIRVDQSSSLSFLNIPWAKNRADRGNKFLN